MTDELIKYLDASDDIVYYPNYGNLGDLLIAEGARQYLKRYGIRYREYAEDNLPDSYTLIYAGGARFTSCWLNLEREVSVLNDPRISKCIVLPHSFYNVDDLLRRLDSRHVLFGRDLNSYHYILKQAPQCTCRYASDMAFHLRLEELPALRLPDEPNEEEAATALKIRDGLFQTIRRRVRKASVRGCGSLDGKRVAFLLRRDREKISHYNTAYTYDISEAWHTSGRDMAYNSEILRQFSAALRQVDVIVSDRLHVCIMAFLSGCEVYLLDNLYGKLSGVYQLSAMKDSSRAHLLADGCFPHDLQKTWDVFMMEQLSRDRARRNRQLAKKLICHPLQSLKLTKLKPDCDEFFSLLRLKQSIGLKMPYVASFGSPLDPLIYNLNRRIFHYRKSDYIEPTPYIIRNRKLWDVMSAGSSLDTIIDAKGTQILSPWPLRVFGSGFDKAKNTEVEQFVRPVEFYALRGKLSRERCRNITKCDLNHVVLGDPGLLISRLYPEIEASPHYDVGVVCLRSERQANGIDQKIRLSARTCTFIDRKATPEALLKAVSECRFILSSDLYGLICADSLGIPNCHMVLAQRETGTDYSFLDYYSAFACHCYSPQDLTGDTVIDDDLINQLTERYRLTRDEVNEICDNLLRVCPIQ